MAYAASTETQSTGRAWNGLLLDRCAVVLARLKVEPPSEFVAEKAQSISAGSLILNFQRRAVRRDFWSFKFQL